MPDSPQRPGQPWTQPIERLYVLWIFSTIALLLLIIILTLLASGRVSRQSEAIRELGQRLVDLETSVQKLTDELQKRPQPPAPATRPRTTPDSRTPRDNGSAARPPRQPPLARTQPAAPIEPVEPAPPPRTDYAARLDRVLLPGVQAPLVLGDPDQAARLLADVMSNAGDPALPADTWDRLAALAILLGERQTAEALAQRAVSAGREPLAFLDTAARHGIDTQQRDLALLAAQRLAAVQPENSAARLLLAQALMLPPTPDPPAAEQQLAEIDQPAQLSLADRARLGRMLIRLEMWERLPGVIESLDRAPADFAFERDLLKAVAAVHENRLVEALAVLDYLVEQRPGDYDARVWRAAALVMARSYEAARAALQIASEQPSRPEAWYWLGVLELQTGNTEGAESAFDLALVAAPRYAPAWEAKATFALESRDIDLAVQNLSTAIQAAPRRSSAHFLLAIAHAKMSRREPAADALRTALSLDPSWLERALEADVLTRLIDPAEMSQMAAGPQTQPASGEAQPAGNESQPTTDESPPDSGDAAPRSDAPRP